MNVIHVYLGEMLLCRWFLFFLSSKICIYSLFPFDRTRVLFVYCAVCTRCCSFSISPLLLYAAVAGSDDMFLFLYVLVNPFNLVAGMEELRSFGGRKEGGLGARAFRRCPVARKKTMVHGREAWADIYTG